MYVLHKRLPSVDFFSLHMKLIVLYNLTLQLDIGFSQKQTSDSSDQQSHHLHVSAQHQTPPGAEPLLFTHTNNSIVKYATTAPSSVQLQTLIRVHIRS